MIIPKSQSALERDSCAFLQDGRELRNGHKDSRKIKSTAKTTSPLTNQDEIDYNAAKAKTKVKVKTATKNTLKTATTTNIHDLDVNNQEHRQHETKPSTKGVTLFQDAIKTAKAMHRDIDPIPGHTREMTSLTCPGSPVSRDKERAQTQSRQERGSETKTQQELLATARTAELFKKYTTEAPLRRNLPCPWQRISIETRLRYCSCARAIEALMLAKRETSDSESLTALRPIVESATGLGELRPSEVLGLERLFATLQKEGTKAADNRRVLGGVSLLCRDSASQKISMALGQIESVKGAGTQISLESLQIFLRSVFAVLTSSLHTLVKTARITTQELGDLTALQCFEDNGLPIDGMLEIDAFIDWFATQAKGLAPVRTTLSNKSFILPTVKLGQPSKCELHIDVHLEGSNASSAVSYPSTTKGPTRQALTLAASAPQRDTEMEVKTNRSERRATHSESSFTFPCTSTAIETTQQSPCPRPSRISAMKDTTRSEPAPKQWLSERCFLNQLGNSTSALRTVATSRSDRQSSKEAIVERVKSSASRRNTASKSNRENSPERQMNISMLTL